MKIALLSFEYPPLTGFGGIGTYSWYQARALVRLGHEVHVLAGSPELGASAPTEHDGVVVHRFRSRPAAALMRPIGRTGLHWTSNRLENALSMHQGLRRLERTHTFDVVEMPECGAEGLLVNTLGHRATVVRFHSPAQLIMPFYDVGGFDARMCATTERIAIRAARGLTSCSQFLADAVRRDIGVDQPVAVIPNGIDLDLFDAARQVDFRSVHGIPQDRPMILFTGRMERRKGIGLMRDIAASILSRHRVALVLAGDDRSGLVRDEILPNLSRMPLAGSLHHVGQLDLATVRAAVCQSDIFLLPSLWENCPYGCIEAMAAGRAIVSTNHGGMPEMVQHGITGMLADNGNAASFIDQIDILLSDADLRGRLGVAARASAAAIFSDTEMATRTAQVYDQVAGAHR